MIQAPLALERATGERMNSGDFTSKGHFDEPAAWLAAAEYTRASWWSHWSSGLDAQGGRDQVPARKPGDRDLRLPEDAPGGHFRAF